MPAEGQTEPSEEARAHFSRGQSAYQQGDYEAAIREWQAAHQLDPRPLILFNLAQAYERLGRAQEAIDALDRYIAAADPEDPNLADARARLASLRERVGRTGIRIADAPAGATIEIDGRAWGVTPRPDPIPVEPGTHEVILRKDGFIPYRSAVAVGAGQEIALAVRMDPAPVAESAGSPWPWVFLGSGGGLTVVGLLSGWAAAAVVDDAPFRESNEVQTARALAAVADVMIFLGVVSAGVGLLWWLLDDDDEEEPSSTARLRIDPMLSPNGGGASATVWF